MTDLHVQAAGRPETGTLLEVRDLATHFQTPRGVVRAVDGVSFTLDRGKALGIVGESGSGKTILSRSIMGLLPQRGTTRRGQVGSLRGDRDPAALGQADAPVLGQRDGDDLPGPDDVAQPADEDRHSRSPSRCGSTSA